MAAAGLFLPVLLALFVRQMEPDWTYSTQYSYGWMVLPCALYLGWLRWKDRPEPAAVRQAPILYIALLLLLLLAPIRLVQEANPDWRLISWMLGGILCVLALLPFYRSGGKPWLRHFAFPCLFPLVAIPWPTWMEQDLIQALTRLVTAITVEGLNLAGIPALQHGNLIELSQSWIGVNDACSGVRSFQATLMVALFLGEMFRFGWKQRLIFLAGGLGLALLGNILRAFFLSWLAVQGGASSLEDWHDPAGLSILAGVFVLLLLVAFRLDKQTRKRRSAPPPPLPSSSGLRISPRWCGAALSWIVLAEIGTELWYRSHEQESLPSPTWSLQLPSGNPSLITDALPDEAHSMLRYDEGYRAAWNQADGTHWAAIFLRWKPGRNAAQLAQTHAPEVCLTATGLQFSKDLGTRKIQAHGQSFHFRMLEFKFATGPLYVFYLLSEDRQLSQRHQNLLQDYSARSRWEAVRAGRRHLGQRLLEISIARSSSAENSVEQLRTELPSLLKMEAANGP